MNVVEIVKPFVGKLASAVLTGACFSLGGRLAEAATRRIVGDDRERKPEEK